MRVVLNLDHPSFPNSLSIIKLLKINVFISLFLLSIIGCSETNSENTFSAIQIFVGNSTVPLDGTEFGGLQLDPLIVIDFNVNIDQNSATEGVRFLENNLPLDIQVTIGSAGKSIRVRPLNPLKNNTVYSLEINPSLRSEGGLSAASIKIPMRTVLGDLNWISATIDDIPWTTGISATEINLNPTIQLEFSVPLDPSTLERSILINGPGRPSIRKMLGETPRQIIIEFDSNLDFWTKYTLVVNDRLKGSGGEPFSSLSLDFYTTVDKSPKFPTITDEELLDLVQAQTFKYFWDFGHPNSGMAKERNRSGDLVTSGGSGFGLMAMIVAVERGFINRQEAVSRWIKITDFLENADRFHGVWSHWINGNTGMVIPFSQYDDGGDLVETAFLAQGLITVRQYLDESVAQEKALVEKINDLLNGIEWSWYTKGGENVLYWHWSPNHAWRMNLPIRGYNETLITYVLAAGAENHTITPDVWHMGWARNGQMKNNKVFYNYTLPLGNDLGGPLFFAHYSYLGLDPRKLKDSYADYWEQNVNHTLINRAYCIDNPLGYPGYSEDCWGLTASDGPTGYSAHSPRNDRGVITPTAALSSMPYTPEESMQALKHFYYILGDQLWGEYGFYDSFDPGRKWVASSYLAIDQGPIICMIENQRTGLLWNLFMSAPEVIRGLERLGFTYQ